MSHALLILPAGIAFAKPTMMKKLFLYTAMCCSLLGACQSKKDSDDASEAKRNVSKRDYSITKANSYSDLFLDSSVMETYITVNKLADSIAKRVRSFYNSRNYQFAWFSSDGLTEQARGFWNLHDYVTAYANDSALKDKNLQKKMDGLVMQERFTGSAGDKSLLNTELKLTEHFIRYMLGNFEKGYVKRKEMERFVPRKREDPLAVADSLINKKHKDDKYYEEVNDVYGALKGQLKLYSDIVRKGGWPTVPAGKTSYKKGTSAPAIAVIKQRLRISGDLQGNDTTQVFNDTLELAVKNFQERHGYKPDGVIGPNVIKEMNVPAIVRLEQVLLNMERMRWTPIHHEGNLMLVNIPEFILHIYEGKKEVITMPVVVGKESNNTMMFNGDLSTVVFSPYWNVPPSIVKNEIMPAIERNPGYLESQNMEMTPDGGIRQRPGGGNALGKVKFLFPNSFNIYLHDTPSKSLFSRDKRAFSHGCIRVSDPEGLANYVLRKQPEWTPDKINMAMNAGEEKHVRVKDPIPVIITYYTAWVDDRGRVNFREDIYGHDKKVVGKMFNK
jgi:L,D-transpeptidase YcbB